EHNRVHTRAFGGLRDPGPVALRELHSQAREGTAREVLQGNHRRESIAGGVESFVELDFLEVNDFSVDGKGPGAHRIADRLRRSRVSFGDVNFIAPGSSVAGHSPEIEILRRVLRARKQKRSGQTKALRNRPAFTRVSYARDEFSRHTGAAPGIRARRWFDEPNMDCRPHGIAALVGDRFDARL